MRILPFQFLWLGMMFLMTCPGLVRTVVGQEPEIIELKEKSSQDALDIYSDAAKFQNNSKFEIAVEEWEAFQKDFQDDPYAPKAIYYLGICALQLKQFDKAAKAFEFTATRYNRHESTESALFYWGRTRYAQAATVKDAKQKTAHLTTAIAAFEKQLETFDKGVLADQAHYLLAESFYGLDDKPRAITAYQSVVTQFPKSNQRENAIYALGATLEETQKYEEAGKMYDLFLAEFPEATLRTEIRMRKAETILQAKNYAEAAEIFAEVSVAEGFALVNHSRMRHGFCLKMLKDFEAASVLFLQFMTDSEAAEFHLEAAGHLHSICRSYLTDKKYDEALKLTESLRGTLKDKNLLVQVEIAAGDALNGQEKYEEARSRYLEVVQKYPEHGLAAEALYFAAFAALKLKQYDGVIQDASAFVKQFPKHEFRKDVTKLLEEARILKSAELFENKKYAEVLVILKVAIQENPTGTRADDNLLLLARSSAELNQFDEAKQYALQLIQDHPKSDLLAETRFRLGEYLFQAKQYAMANQQYALVVSEHAESPYVANALYSQAWSQVFLGEQSAAEKMFTVLIEKHPEHKLVALALLGRGKSRRQQQKFDETIVDMDAFLKTEPSVDLQTDAWFEKGMSQIGLQQHENAIETFGQLLEADPKFSNADSVLYEIAFAQRALEKPDAAKTTFEKLLADHADSALAADSHFRLAEYQYADEDFKESVEHYTSALAQSKDATPLQENIIHKQAWAYFKLTDYEKSVASFKDQIAKYPEGGFVLDGKFMLAESLYKLENYQAALDAFLELMEVEFPAAQYSLLVRLHSGKAASELKSYEQARGLLQQVVDSEDAVADSYRREAHFEIGWSYDREQNYEKALPAFTSAGRDRGAIGARAHFMIGDIAFKQKQFTEAIKQFDRTILRFEDEKAPEDVKQWQALAAFEAGRCKEVLAGEVKDDPTRRKIIVTEAIAYYQMIVDKYPQTEYVKQAQQRIEELGAIK